MCIVIFNSLSEDILQRTLRAIFRRKDTFRINGVRNYRSYILCPMIFRKLRTPEKYITFVCISYNLPHVTCCATHDGKKSCQNRGEKSDWGLSKRLNDYTIRSIRVSNASACICVARVNFVLSARDCYANLEADTYRVPALPIRYYYSKSTTRGRYQMTTLTRHRNLR